MSFRGIFAASFALVVLLATLTIGFAYSELETKTNADAWVAHTYDAIEQNQLVLTLVQRAESAERAYLISGEESYLDLYEKSRERVPVAQGALARMVADNAGEVSRVGSLNQAIDWRLDQLQKSVALAKAGDAAGAKEAALAGAGGPRADIRSTSEAVAVAERDLLEARVGRAGGAIEISLAIGVALAAVSLLALLAFVYSLARANQNLINALDQAAQANAERARAEERLREAHRMEAMGQLTGGVAHDFNNLLQVIRGNLELLEPALAKNADGRRRLASAIHGADRAAQLTRQLLAFARRQPLAAETLDLAKLVGDMTEILRRTLGDDIEVTTEIAPDLWNALADSAQMESAILNLAINARDAMPNGGHLIVEAANAHLEAADLEQVEDVLPGDYVMVAVTDAGEGMTAETRARAVEPFFTTKRDGKGSGLGLSMVYGFVRQSNGHMRLESEAGEGTSVRLYLPRSLADASPEASPAVAPAKGRNETILVIEDDATVRATTVTLLESLGYRCLEAADAASAVERVKGGAKIALIFSDVMMPGPMKTRDMANRLRKLAPGVPILFTSGYPREEIGRGGKLDADITLLAKPYARDALAAKIAQMLSEAAAASSPPPKTRTRSPKPPSSPGVRPGDL